MSLLFRRTSDRDHGQGGGFSGRVDRFPRKGGRVCVEPVPPAMIPAMSRRVRILVQILIATGLGAGYGLWGLEAASPLAIPLILWAALVLLLVWRLPPEFGLLFACASGYVAGFGAVWTFVLGQLIATCKPPTCQTADAATDVLYAAALLIPLLLVASGLIALRRRVSYR